MIDVVWEYIVENFNDIFDEDNETYAVETINPKS